MSANTREELPLQPLRRSWPQEFCKRRTFYRESENIPYIESLSPVENDDSDSSDGEGEELVDGPSNCISEDLYDDNKNIDPPIYDNLESNEKINEVEAGSRISVVRRFMEGMIKDQDLLPYRDQVEQVASFCERESATEVGTAVALLEDMNHSTSTGRLGRCRPYKGPLTPQQLREELSKKRFNDKLNQTVRVRGEECDVERRVIYITNLDAPTIEALAMTAPRKDALALKNLFYNNLMNKASMGVTIPSQGFLTFTLDLNIPYYVLKESRALLTDSRKRFNGEQLRRSWELPFFSGVNLSKSTDTIYCLYEAQISIAITGIDYSVWTAYGIFDTYFESKEGIEAYHRMKLRFAGQDLDILSAGFLTASNTMPPREYFFKAFEIRITQVRREWNVIIDLLDGEIQQSKMNRELPLLLNDSEIRQELRRISAWSNQMVRLLRQLTRTLWDTVGAWDKLKRKDISYFLCDGDGDSPINSSFLRSSVEAVDDCFVDLKDILEKLRHLERELCQDSPQGLHAHYNQGNHEAQVFQQKSARHIQILTVITIVYLPLALAAAMFNTQGVLPLTPSLSHFTYVLFIIVVLVIVAVVTLLKWQSWLRLAIDSFWAVGKLLGKETIMEQDLETGVGDVMYLTRGFSLARAPSQADLEMVLPPASEGLSLRNCLNSIHTATSSLLNCFGYLYSPLGTSDREQQGLGGLHEARRTWPIDPLGPTANQEIETIQPSSHWSRVRRPRPTFRLFVNLNHILKRLFRPGCVADKQRIEWTCQYGHELYADLSNRLPEENNRLAAILQCTGDPTNTVHESYGMSTRSRIPSPAKANSINRSPSSSSNQSGIGSTSSTLVEHNSTANPFNNQETESQSYLELCINTGQYTKTLCEIDLGNIRCDGELFERIRTEYFSRRKFRFSLWLLKPSGIHFVKFALQHSLRVAILQKPLSIPPQEEVDSKRYTYSPCPLDDDPPIPSDVFLHYLNCNSPDPFYAWLPRLPKKLNSSILHFLGPINEGWGIHITEGPNWFAIGMLNLFMMVMSGVAAGLWKLYMNDFQGAFGFAGWVVGAVNAILLVYIAKWSRP